MERIAANSRQEAIFAATDIRRMFGRRTETRLTRVESEDPHWLVEVQAGDITVSRRIFDHGTPLVTSATYTVLGGR